MIQLAASNSPIDAAWAAFDTAALRLYAMYRDGSPTWDAPTESKARCELAQEVARLWNEWQALFLGEGPDPRPAA